YLEKGNEALTGIKEDIETDIAERLPKTPFVNYVGFEFTGDDFVSVKDNVSMDSMTKTNLEIFEKKAASNPSMAAELDRAETEAQEAAKLTAWFKNAPVGAYLIFESLPIGEQKIAISRIYQKTSSSLMDGCFVSLYSPSVEQFNGLRSKLGAKTTDNETEKDILQNCYEFYDPNLTLPDKFISHYVGTYDQLLQTQNNQQYSFGLEKDQTTEKQNGILKVRSQPKLTSIYLDTIKTLGSSKGIVTPGLIQITDKLGTIHQLKENQVITKKMAHDIISDVILGIASVIDKADSKLLGDLEHSDTNEGANYAAMSYFGNEAKAAGETYDSGGCPTYNMSNETMTANDTNTEYNIMQISFNSGKTPNNFGVPKIGVCRILNCPSRGDVSWWSDKTLVGGCDFCVSCHKILEKGKSPKNTYADRKRKDEQSSREIAKKRLVASKSKVKRSFFD
ncbi:hypothetical protein H7X68_04005, partial [Candidatus Saccharibacteria bacterium]|nr:hypothetical protein [Candidatus Saccharibacteria bacterium]